MAKKSNQNNDKSNKKSQKKKKLSELSDEFQEIDDSLEEQMENGSILLNENVPMEEEEGNVEEVQVEAAEPEEEEEEEEDYVTSFDEMGIDERIQMAVFEQGW
jgi:seryl-tRNA synthetase